MIDLLKRLQNRTAMIGIVGLGYVGLPLAVAFAEAGYKVIGLDIDQDKVLQLNTGHSYIADVSSDKVAALIKEKRLYVTARYDLMQYADAVSICVPTPLTKDRTPDLCYVIDAINSVVEIAHQQMLIVLESTTYPGTTEDVIVPRLKKQGLIPGHNIFVAFSPERIDPANKTYGVRNTPKVVGGITPDCMAAAVLYYSAIVDRVVPVSSTATAEMVKLLENTFRAVNIGFINEMAILCKALSVDIWEVIEAASTKPFGFMPFYPGPGLGGHCIPLDPLYLNWKLNTLGLTSRFITLAIEINESMPDHVIEMIKKATGRPLEGLIVRVIGVAYKRNVSDVRESPALTIINRLNSSKVYVQYHDPYVPEIELDGGRKMLCSTLDKQWLGCADCVVIVTGHSGYDWQFIVDHSNLVIDTRNATQYVTPAGNVITL